MLVALTALPAFAEEAVDLEARAEAADAQAAAAQAKGNAAQAQQGISNVAGGLVALEARVAALEAALAASGLPPISSITVDCAASESIQDAVDLATPGTPLTITVFGTCIETVTITDDLRGGPRI